MQNVSKVYNDLVQCLHFEKQKDAIIKGVWMRKTNSLATAQVSIWY